MYLSLTVIIARLPQNFLAFRANLDMIVNISNFFLFRFFPPIHCGRSYQYTARMPRNFIREPTGLTTEFETSQEHYCCELTEVYARKKGQEKKTNNFHRYRRGCINPCPLTSYSARYQNKLFRELSPRLGSLRGCDSNSFPPIRPNHV